MLFAHSLPTLGWDEALLRLALAAALGGAVGIERELREREAGFRTHLLVALGSALFTIVSAYAFHSFLASGATVVRADPTRIAAQRTKVMPVELPGELQGTAESGAYIVQPAAAGLKLPVVGSGISSPAPARMQASQNTQ